jgi:predicted nucleotidyltransferase
MKTITKTYSINYKIKDNNFKCFVSSVIEEDKKEKVIYIKIFKNRIKNKEQNKIEKEITNFIEEHNNLTDKIKIELCIISENVVD